MHRLCVPVIVLSLGLLALACSAEERGDAAASPNETAEASTPGSPVDSAATPEPPTPPASPAAPRQGSTVGPTIGPESETSTCFAAAVAAPAPPRNADPSGGFAPGELIWSAEGGAVSPVIVGEILVAGDADGRIYARDALTGIELWQRDVGGRSSPSAGEGFVYSGSRTLGRAALSVGRDFVYAHDARTGEECWSRDVYSVYRAPLVADNVIYFTSADGYAHALDARTGETLWDALVDARYGVLTLVTSEQSIFVTDIGGIHALDIQTGQELWYLEVSIDPGSTPALAQGTLYAGGFDGFLRAIDAESGEELWAVRVAEAGSSGGAGSPRVSNGVAYVGSVGVVTAIDIRERAILWRFPGLDHAIGEPPAVMDGKVYFADSQTLVAVDAATGAKLWTYPAGGAGSTIVVGHGIVFLGGNDGVLYAVAAE